MKEHLAFYYVFESLKPFQQAQHTMKTTKKSSLNVFLKEILHRVRLPQSLTEMIFLSLT